ncbi:MAG: hypothetical protein HOV68_17710 [Streptomycetaceae bacterium]|nr:hypothetical protein [Streptomycetaceae bacterium]
MTARRPPGAGQLQLGAVIDGTIDPARGEARKQAGIARADKTARQLDPAWCRDCDAAIEEMARRGVVFQASDMVKAELVGEPPHHSCWGGRLRSAASRGVIEHVGWDNSHRGDSNSSGLKTWRGTDAWRTGGAA